MNNNNNKNKGMKDGPKIWNDTEVNLLKKWGEQAASYRVLHNRAYRKYKYLTALFTIPVIIISTLTGTANFSQGTIIQIYPGIDVYLPLFIGALNLISGIITTIGQFLRVSELNEANRNASISYGKFARNICTELSLPPNERTYSGIDFIQICRNEMDRLIEQSPEIGMKIINKFESNKKFQHIIKPELINISPIEVYKPSKEEKTKEMVAGAANKFRQNFIKTKLKDLDPHNISNSKVKEYDMRRDVELELAEIRDNKILKNEETIRKVSSVFENKNNTHVVDMTKVKNMFENNEPVQSRTKLVPKPKITSIADLVSKDNLDLIRKNKDSDETDTIEEKIDTLEEKIDTGATSKILNKLDTVKSNIEKNININDTLKILSNVEEKIKDKVDDVSNTTNEIINVSLDVESGIVDDKSTNVENIDNEETNVNEDTDNEEITDNEETNVSDNNSNNQ